MPLGPHIILKRLLGIKSTDAQTPSFCVPLPSIVV